MERYNVIGVMSGTSMDGLDIAYCNFRINNKALWEFKIICATTIHFTYDLQKKLAIAKESTGIELMKLHNEFGNFIGNSVKTFIEENNIDRSEINCISSHGHTVFHQPNMSLTTQIGNGANISAITRLPVVCDFRSVDVALTGQGAPLVPIGDELLFANYDICINLGGIANISYPKNNVRIAFDICPVNIVLNKLANELNQLFDESGNISKSGKINEDLLNQLDHLEYYTKSHPKSLGIEWIENTIFPLLHNSEIPTTDKLRTFVEHISIQIANYLTDGSKDTLFTGGGTFNTFLMERINRHSNSKIIIPDQEIIHYKEALIFAFLGVLRLKNEVNCLKSVTGANENNIGGCIYQVF